MKRSPLKRRSLKKRGSPHRYLESEFCKLIRKRDKKCLKGGDCGGRLEAAHVWPKGKYPLLRCFPLNCITLCSRHHRYTFWHKSPGDAWPWFVETFPKDWLDRLMAERRHGYARKFMTEAEIRTEWAAFGLGNGKSLQ